MRDISKGVATTSFIVGRFDGSLERSWLTSSRSSLEYCCGAGMIRPLEILCTRPFMSLALNAWRRLIISYSTQPRDHMSLLKEYGFACG